MRGRRKWTALLLAAALAAAQMGCGAENAGRQETGLTQEDAAAAEERAPSADGEQAAAEDGEIPMGRYMESSFLLPENANVRGRAMQLLQDGRLAYFDSVIGLYVSEDEGRTWKAQKSMQELIPDREAGYISTAVVGPDGSVAMCEGFYEDMDNVRHNLVYVNAEGDRIEADGMCGDGGWITKLCFGADGRLFAAGIKGGVYEIDRTSGERRTLFTPAECPEVLAVSGKLLLALESSGVQIYHLESGMLMDPDIVLDEFCQQHLSGRLGGNSDCVGAWLLPGEEGVLYLACQDGVFRHVLSGNAMEQLIEGSFSTFGDPTLGICSMALTGDVEFLLLTTADELIRFTYDANEPTVPQNVLKIYSLEENSRLRQAISVYQKENPDVYVSYEVGMAEGSAVTRMDALKNLNLELVGGDGPDVLLMDGIEHAAYAEKGMLKDLEGILWELEKEGEVFENIVSAYRTENKTFVVPTSFKLPLIVGKEEDIVTVTDLESLADLTERLAQDVEYGCVTGSMKAEQELYQLLCVCSPAWLAGGELNEEALAGFLTQAKRIYDADRSRLDPELIEKFNYAESAMPVGVKADHMMIGIGKLAFGEASRMLMDVGAIGHFTEEEEGYAFDLWSGQAGKGFVAADKLAIAAQSAHGEEAERFVRLVLSYEVQSVNMGEGFPVNRSAFEKMCEWQESSIGGTWRGPDGDVEYGNGWPKAETTDRLRELVEQAKVCLEGNDVLNEAVIKYGAQVLEGSMSVEDGVRLIKKEVSIYLSEQK